MRSRSKRVILAAVVLAVVSGIFAYFSRDEARIQYHLHQMQRAGHLLEVLAGKVPQTRHDRVTRLLSWPDTNSHWADIYQHHEDALIRLGYLTRQEFPFSRGAFTSDELLTNALPLMSDWTGSFSLSRSQAVVQVLARPAQMGAWAALIGELDKRHRP
jgi:hypothetical protein